MGAAFKTFPPSGTADEGEYGTSPYGQEAYGGTQTGTKYDLPANEIPGDDLTRSDHWNVGEVAHRRSGILLGARKFTEKRVWRVRFGDLSSSDVDTLLVFYKARRFKLIPDSAEEETYYTVHWVETEFDAVPQRGARYRLEFTIEEV